jgi:hypothetical protein
MNVIVPAVGEPNPAFAQPASRERLEGVARALERRGIQVLLAKSAEDAKQLTLDLVPTGSEVHIALSETMAQVGITPEIEASGRYDAIRPKLLQLDRVTQGREMRKLAAAPDYILGSVHAITDDGLLLIASGSGSQLGPYAQSAGKVILVVGHQKVVRTLEEGLRRIQEYSLPLEDARMKRQGRAGSAQMKTLIIHGEPQGRITVVLVPETLGF